jgi:peptidoglycan hydrolase CwlO-like protein
MEDLQQQIEAVQSEIETVQKRIAESDEQIRQDTIRLEILKEIFEKL